MFNFAPKLLFQDQSPLYGSPLPAFNIDQAADNVKNEKFTDVIVLIEGDTGEALKNAYIAKGIDAKHFSIEDFDIPSNEELAEWIPQIVKLVQSPNHKILVHCMGGQGRTGLISACVLAYLKHYKGDKAIKEIRQIIPHAVETQLQGVCVRNFANKYFSQEK